MSNSSCLIFTARLKDAYPSLSDMEKCVADYMLKNPEGMVNATARDIADACGVNTATVIRFCKSCGFSGLSELKMSLRREYVVPDEGTTSTKYLDVMKNDSISIIRQKVLGYHNLIISNMLSDWNLDAYSLAVDALIQAKRVLIIGEGGSRCSAICLFHILTNLGLSCETYMDSVFEIMRVGSLEENDVVIGITFTGRLRNTVDSLKLAKERHATTIGLVGYLHSPIMDYVDILLNTTKIKKGYYDSALSIRVSEIAVIEILSTLLAMRLDRPIEPTTDPHHVVSIRRIWGDE